MKYYYVALISRSQAFLLERRLKGEGISCELAFMPREIMTDLCNMGVRFSEYEFPKAINVIRRSGLPGCKVFKEEMDPDAGSYYEISY